MAAKYQQLAQQLIADIKAEKLLQGSKMPSIRDFSRRHGISINTSLSCYHQLEAQGWLQARSRSGFYVCRPFGEAVLPQAPHFTAKVTRPSMPLSVTLAGKSPFYVSVLSPELTPKAALDVCARRSRLMNEESFYFYPDYQGDSRLRELLAQHFSRYYLPLNAGQLLVTNGCIDAIRTAIEVTTSPGDAVAVTSPCFNGLLALLATMGRLVVELPFKNQALDLKQLEQLLQEKTVTACLLSSNHINPQGVCLSPQQKQALAELACHYQCPVIEDDVYLELNHNKACPLPVKYWDKEGWVLWCGSVSKSLTPSYRLGWCEPGRFFDAYLSNRCALTFGVNLAVQQALAEYIYCGQYGKHLKKLTRSLGQQVRIYYRLLKEKLPQQARISTPDGGMVLWIQVPGLNSELLLETAAKQGIYFRPGGEFTTLGLYQDCFRLNVAWSISEDVDKHPQAGARYRQLLVLCQLVHQQLTIVN